MKTALKKIYFSLVRPLYERLSRELVLQNQQLVSELIASEERFSKMYSSELVLLNAKVQHLEEALAVISKDTETQTSQFGPPDLIDRHIADAVGLIEKTGDIVKASKQLELSVSDMLHFEKKYRGMNAQGVHRARLLEKENELLKKNLLSLE